MTNHARSTRITVSADGHGLMPQAGAVMLRVTGPGRGLSGSAGAVAGAARCNDPGKIIADPAAPAAPGGE
jgi:hypothetical protein